MKYMGSKARLMPKILPFINKGLQTRASYVEPFAGGMNSMCQVKAQSRIAGEVNPYIAAMWQELLSGWTPKSTYSKDEYMYIQNNKNECPHLTGYVGICCSYSGKWFGGYAGRTRTSGGIRDYQDEAWRNVKKQLPALRGVQVYCSSYELLHIPSSSVIYCDPPYMGTTKYAVDFDTAAFFSWVRVMVAAGHIVLVSEYSAPADFVELLKLDVVSSLSANGTHGGSKSSTEKLFIHKSQVSLMAEVM